MILGTYNKMWKRHGFPRTNLQKNISVFHIKVRLQEGKLWSGGINHPNLCVIMGFIMAPIGAWSWMNLWLSGGLEAGWSVASSIICVPRVSRRKFVHLEIFQTLKTYDHIPILDSLILGNFWSHDIPDVKTNHNISAWHPSHPWSA